MSRTHHHSRKFGADSRWADRSDRAAYTGNSEAGEAPGWHVRLFFERPYRRADRMTVLEIVKGNLDPDNATYFRGRGRKPHIWCW
ncbi:hypothetical protein [Roseococcus sp. YIM B11640]|uniref:hypothetical protein n=1 Tax=Roseococcus sp. YIM B11640 TaxID=3133973 RepID=UPI003C7AD4C6